MNVLHFDRLPDCVIKNRAARAALARWAANHAQRRLISAPARGQPGSDPTQQTAPAGGAVAGPEIRPGMAVWYRLRTRDGAERALRCQIMSRRDELTGRWLLASIDNRHHQFYACTSRIVPRFAGELAPAPEFMSDAAPIRNPLEAAAP